MAESAGAGAAPAGAAPAGEKLAAVKQDDAKLAHVAVRPYVRFI